MVKFECEQRHLCDANIGFALAHRSLFRSEPLLFTGNESAFAPNGNESGLLSCLFFGQILSPFCFADLFTFPLFTFMTPTAIAICDQFRRGVRSFCGTSSFHEQISCCTRMTHGAGGVSVIPRQLVMIQTFVLRRAESTEEGQPRHRGNKSQSAL